MTDDAKLDFWIKCVIDTSQGYIKGSISRAYRDFNRTFEDFPKSQKWRIEWRDNLTKRLEDKIVELFGKDLENQEAFTIWHQQTIVLLLMFLEDSEFRLTIGQAQKWINMTLKYLSILGEEKVSGVMRNYRFYHIPIDNLIQDELANYGIMKIPIVWSKIKDYDTYYLYQKSVRLEFEEEIPLDVEFRLFNQIMRKK
jgi:hypothetical protein